MSTKIWQLMDFLGMLFDQWQTVRGNKFFGAIAMTFAAYTFAIAVAMVWLVRS